jgi:GAF domain-containing protein
MVEMTPALAERLSEVARLLGSGHDDDAVLLRLTRLGVELIPGATAAAVTIPADDQPHTFAASDPRVDQVHWVQFDSGEGPVVETLRYNESRHARDVRSEPRWPAFCDATAGAGFLSCLTLPVHADRDGSGAMALYGDRPGAFSGASHDLALLFAAQAGTAVHNDAIYATCRQMVANLQAALESRAVIEQAKGMVHMALEVSPEEAFQLISRTSQNTNEKVRDVAARLVRGDIDPRRLRRPRPPRAKGRARGIR